MSYSALLPTLAAFSPDQPKSEATSSEQTPGVRGRRASPASPRSSVPSQGASAVPHAEAYPGPRAFEAPLWPPVPATPGRSSQPRRAFRWSPPALVQLYDALKLAVRDVLHADLGERLDAYRSCRWCAARAQWCAEGVAHASL